MSKRKGKGGWRKWRKWEVGGAGGRRPPQTIKVEGAVKDCSVPRKPIAS